MLIYKKRNRQRADRAKFSFRSLESLSVQPLVLQFDGAFLACLLVLLAVGPLTVHAAIFDEKTGRTFLQHDGATSHPASSHVAIRANVLHYF